MALNPLFFGASDRRLYGMYDPSATGGEHGAVICAPFGQEYLRAHQSLRQLARMFARAGVHAFRFDYYGTGDSDGSDVDGSFDQWVDDTAAAIEELKDTAGVRKVSIVGLRAGAAIAARAIASRRDMHRVALWDPVFNGRAYVEELVTAHSPRAFPIEIDGLPVSERMFDDVSAISVEMFETRFPRTLVVSTETADAHQLLAGRLRERGTDVSVEFHAAPAAWREIGNTGAAGMPVAAMQAIVNWIAS